MDDTRAKEFIKKVFESEFSKESFTLFVRNLLNTFDDSKSFPSHGYAKEVFAPHIKTYERLGTYIDPSNCKIDILIIYLQKETSIERARSMQRNFVADYLKGEGNKDAALVAFVSPDPSDWRFSFVKMEYEMMTDKNGKVKVNNKFTPVKRYSFLVGPHEASHTAQSRMLPHLKNSITHPTLTELEELFSVEKVTNEFFDEYKDLFADLVDSFSHDDEFTHNVVQKNGIDVADFSKKLMGQIVFLYFIQKKGWLGVKEGSKWGTGDKFFMTNLYKSAYGNYTNFFNEILEPLFYDTLNRRDRSNSSVMGDQSLSARFHCKIPYLNGGLFTPAYEWEKTNIKIENERFRKIFETFDRYNFTVYEPDPIEKEVAIDPEMLGKVFERLLDVKDRKGKGAFYTPREIVQYMCRESLITYLMNNSDIEVERIRSFFVRKDHELGETEEKRAQILADVGLRDRASVLYDLLKKVKICDPAVGSGAFPMGLLKEISSARYYLNTFFIHEKNEKGNILTEYDIKKQTLENCIYGVDIEPGAVEIARLRFWLALIVEHDIEDVEPLPNLDYKIMQGNSLIEHLSDADSKHIDKDLIDLYEKLAEAKHSLFNLTDGSKKEDKIKKIQEVASEIALYTKIKPIREKIMEIRNNPSLFGEISKDEDQLNFDDFLSEDLRKENDKIDKILETHPKSHFEWHLNYSEVFEKGGFDIVIGNPPYVGEKGNKDIFRPIAESLLGKKFYQGKMDLFYFFFHIALDYLNEGGVMAYITTNYYITATGAIKLRKDIHDRSSILKLLNFGELKIFESALGQHNMITMLINGKKNIKARTLITHKKGYLGVDVIRSIINESDPDTDYYEISQEDLYSGDNIKLTSGGLDNILNKIKENSTILSNVCKVNQGIVTGADKVSQSHLNKYKWNSKKGDGIFVLDKNESKNILEKDFLKPWYKNSDVTKWLTQNEAKEEIIYINGITNESKIESIINHLQKFKENLDLRREVHKGARNWYNLWRARSQEIFEGEKIVVPQRSKTNTFGYNNTSWYASADVYFITSSQEGYSLKYLLGVLNSNTVYLWLYNRGKRKGEMLELYQEPLSHIPIPIITQKNIIEVQKIEKLVDQILTLKKQKKDEDTKNLESQIDQLVYELYDLTDEEIKIIEGKKVIL